MDKFSLYLENVDDTNDESDDSGTIYELEILSDSSTEGESVKIKNEILSADKDEDLEIKETDDLIPPCEDNVQIKEENKELSDCKFLTIKTEEVWFDDGCDNDKSSSDTDSGENYSEVIEQMGLTTASSLMHKNIILRKRLKIVPGYLHINSKERGINIALLQLLKKKQYLWAHYYPMGCTKKDDFQKGYESLAEDINEEFSINVSWEFVKNRLNNMRYVCIDEMEKELIGEDFQMPWYFEHMQYLKQNLKSIAEQRIQYKLSKKIGEARLLIVIELYKKHEEMWQVNNIYSHIPSKRSEAYNKMLEELKSDYNIEFKLKQLKAYINYIHRLFSEDRERELKSELNKSNFSPASKHYEKLTFLKDSQGPFKCPHCNDIIQKFESYHIHVAEHTNTMPFKCVLCEGQYKSYICYIQHLKRHAGLIKYDKNKRNYKNRSIYQCDICNKCFVSKAFLNNHKLSHNYQCQICDASFRCSSTYDEHMRSHGKGEDNVQIKEEELSDCEFLNISDVDESYSQMEVSTAFNSRKQGNIFEKGLKFVPDNLHINSKEKNINIALLQLFKLKPYLWNYDQRKFRKDNDFQKEYESIAEDINAKFSINVSWEFVKKRINDMRYMCINEMEKELNGEEFQMPWYFEHMNYLKKNLKYGAKQRIKYKQSKKIDESSLLIVIELYKKYEELWRVNNPYFGIYLKIIENYNKMLEELKSNYNIEFKLKQLKDYISYIHRVFSEDKERELKSELDKSDFSPASKHYENLTFLKDSQGPFKCPHCNDIIQKFESYRIHVAEHTNTIPFKCVFCEGQYTRYAYYLRHLREHVKKRRSYRCDICNAILRRSDTYEKHMRLHEKGFRFECHICKKGFDQFRFLDIHIKSHLNRLDYLCNICGKRLATYSKLRYHKVVHGYKKHCKCDICGKLFVGKSCLAVHRIRKHKLQPRTKLKERENHC